MKQLPLEIIEYILSFNTQEYILFNGNFIEPILIKNIEMYPKKINKDDETDIGCWCNEGVIDHFFIPYDTFSVVKIITSQKYYFNFETIKINVKFIGQTDLTKEFVCYQCIYFKTSELLVIKKKYLEHVINNWYGLRTFYEPKCPILVELKN
jgi:hypothetical protein